MSDNTSSIIKSATRFFSGTMLSRITGMFRDVAMAYAFGTQGAVAGFMVAFRFAHLLRRLFGEGALQTAFIPQFETLRKENPERASLFFRDLILSLSALLLVLIALISAGLWAIISFVDLSPGNQEILYLTLLMMPSLLFICLFGLNASLLQCEKKYFTPSVAPVAFNIIWISIVLALRNNPVDRAMPWLALGVIAGCFFQWLFTVPSTLKFLRTTLPSASNLRENWKLISPDVKMLATPLFLGMVGIAGAQINNALDAIFARYAEPEGPAFLWFAIRIQQLPLALFGIAISGALLPPLSRAIKDGEHTKYHFLLNFALRRSLAIMIPITIALFVLGDTCVNLIYGRGDFINDSIVGTTRTLWGYSVGLIPMTIVLILAPAFYAQNNYRIPTRASLTAVGLNIGLSGLFVMLLGCGAASIALATSLSAWCNALQLGWNLKRQNKNENGPALNYNFSDSLVKILFASFSAGLAVLVWRSFSGSLPIAWNTLLLDGSVLFVREGGYQIFAFAVESVIFCTSLALVAWFIKLDDFLFLKKVELLENSAN